VNYRLGGDASNANDFLAAPTPPETDAWSLHSQTTLVSQYAAPFHAPHRGANSLDQNAGRETWDATLDIGRRLWQGAELWVVDLALTPPREAGIDRMAGHGSIQEML
jgi:high affinity Mn2+ porin